MVVPSGSRQWRPTTEPGHTGNHGKGAHGSIEITPEEFPSKAFQTPSLVLEDLLSGLLKLKRGHKFGQVDENASRFLADQLADRFEISLDMRAGHGDKSAFRAILNVACNQTGLPELERDAVRSITAKYRKSR